MTRARTYHFSVSEVETIKALWPDASLTAGDIGRRLGRPRSTVRAKALALGLPAKPGRQTPAENRSPENISIIKRLFAERVALTTIAKEIGTTRASVARIVKALGLERAAPMGPAPGKTPKAIKPKVEKVAPVVAPAKPKFDFRSAPVRFDPTPRDAPPIGERILHALANRDLNAPTLSTIIGEKELAVGLALAALRHEGRVIDGETPEQGARYRRWRLAA